MISEVQRREWRFRRLLIVQEKLADESAQALANFAEKRPQYRRSGEQWYHALDDLDDTEAHIDMIEKVTCDFENTYGIPDGREFLPLVILTLYYANGEAYPKVKQVRDALERVA